MKIVVTVGGKDHRARLPHEGAAHVDVAGVACPSCGKELLQACGRGQARQTRDAIHKRAVAACCGADVGEIAVYFETLFGLEEDEAVEEQVRRGGGKVYGGGTPVLELRLRAEPLVVDGHCGTCGEPEPECTC